MVVEIKKLHCPESGMPPPAAVKNELDLVGDDEDFGDNTGGGNQADGEEADGGAEGFDMC